MKGIGLSRACLGLIFVVAGILHFLATDFYAAIVPPWLPAPELLVWISGLAEIAGGIGILTRKFRAAAAWGLIALLFAVFPANIQMVIDHHREGGSFLYGALLWLRLPLQFLLIYWVWREGPGASGRWQKPADKKARG